MSFADATGAIAMTFALMIQFGIVAQIRLLRRRKSSDDLSLPMFFFVQCAAFFWVLHGWSIGDVFLMTAQGIGLVTVSVLLCFVLKYRTKKERRPNPKEGPMMFICRTCEEKEKKAGRCERAHPTMAIMGCDLCNRTEACVYCNCQRISASKNTIG